MYSKAHKSYAGLLEMVSGTEVINNWLTDLAEQEFEVSIELPQAGIRKRIFICDSFFSDTVAKQAMTKLVEKSIRLGIDIQIVLLNPFSDAAIEREKSLQPTGRIVRMNLGLRKILDALLPDDREGRKSETDNRIGDPNYIFQQLDAINAANKPGSAPSLQIKFTTTVTFPLYIIGDYACAGQFLTTGSSISAPWFVWVKCPEKNDQYDHLVNHFETLWNQQTEPFATQYLKNFAWKRKHFQLFDPSIFAGYGSDQAILNQLVTKCAKFGLMPKHFNQQKFESTTAPRVSSLLKEMYESCSSAILILTGDDELSDGRKQPRQNAIEELGECRARYGDARVLLIVERGIVLPSNIGDLMLSYLTEDSSNGLSINEGDLSEFVQRIVRLTSSKR